ncbi:LuxR family transcriptional regulator [Kordiimonas marina]|uniref:LuxR family transcriptional regulator n=1 Tax=Kordiimonas marina TaxID=2872312 RepID=UPI001FF10025|nr:LuxR family transcriptional regulator [Kordiimonas marina]MCJ9427490.1 LuxR family transcriptional regulator [Kordiimonas marina]
MNLEYFQLAMEFIESSKTIDNLDDLGRSFQNTARKLGFEHYACVSCVEFGSMPEGAVFLADYPEDWTNYYLENSYERKDRILQVSLKQHLPFNWENEIVTKGMNAQQSEIFSEAEDAGLLYGVTVPIHVVGAFPGAVNVVGENRDVDPAAEHAIHLMSVYLHDAALRLKYKNDGQVEPITKLTTRERECLEWVAAGKTDWEISAILSIAERTVHNHVESAKVKLGVHTRVQAVVKAFLSNLIHYR